jgi:hypothetical protein
MVLNLAISYVLMLAASRQYLEAILLDALAMAWPATYAPLRLADAGAEQEVEEEAGQWVVGRDSWARAWARNALRTLLVLLTAQLCLSVPHFALLSGLIGGLTDSLQSLVLPPLAYLAESSKRLGVLRRRRYPSASSSSRSAAGASSGTHYASIRPASGGDPAIDAEGSAFGAVPPWLEGDEWSIMVRGRIIDLRRAAEVASCGALALFGCAFIAFATLKNLAAISVFLYPPATEARGAVI